MPRLLPSLHTTVLVAGIAVIFANNSPANPPEPAPIEIPVESNALDSWRARFDQLDSIDSDLRGQLVTLSSPISHDTLDTELMARLRPLNRLIDSFTLQPEGIFRFPAVHGPETPFPDHAPLTVIAQMRLALMKLAWLDGQPDRAILLARQNLDFASVTLHAQMGIIPVITAAGIWQTSLDGVYWLARQPGLTPADAATLQTRLTTNHDLAALSLARAFNGEYTFVQKVIIDRLTITNDPELILDSIGSFGMTPAVAPGEGEPRLPITDRMPFDPEATLAGVVREVDLYLAELRNEPYRFPRTLPARLLAPIRAERIKELGPLLTYAISDTPITLESIDAASKVLDRVENPLGKLYLLLAIPNWNAVAESLYRRQAQNNMLQGLLAWRQLGHTADWNELLAAHLIRSIPPDPFSDAPLLLDTQRACIWSVGLNGSDNGGLGDGENIGRPDDLTWPWSPAEL